MTYTENVFAIVIAALILFGAMCILCYQLGKAEGREQAKEELERKRTVYTRNGRRPRIY